MSSSSLFQYFEENPEACGFFAALVGALGFGSFCVPMKSEAARSVDVDPLVFQSYKTLMSFSTSFFVLFLGVEKLTISPWGFVSGLFWIPAGVLHVCAVRTAGLAISQGTASSLNVLVSFVWGIFFFQERVRSIASALFAVFLMCCGIFGMSYCSAPQPAEATKNDADDKPTSGGGGVLITIPLPKRSWFYSSSINDDDHGDVELSSAPKSGDDDQEDVELLTTPTKPQPSSELVAAAATTSTNTTSSQEDVSQQKTAELAKRTRMTKTAPVSRPNKAPSSGGGGILSGSASAEEMAGLLAAAANSESSAAPKKNPAPRKSNSGAHAIVSGLAALAKSYVGVDLTVRQMGIVASALGAIWGGSMMVPLQFAGEDSHGLAFVFSFAVGAVMVNGIFILLRFYYHYTRSAYSLRAAYLAMPSFHWEVMAVPGCVSGVLYSIGNMAGTVSVTYLGEGVGWSLTQGSMLIAGLWGIFYFQEITDTTAIRGWLVSACVTIAGILLLSYNHLPSEGHEAVLKH